MIKIKIHFIGGFNRDYGEFSIDENSTYLDLLNLLDINPETVVLLKDGKPVPLDDRVEEGELKVLRVISGG